MPSKLHRHVATKKLRDHAYQCEREDRILELLIFFDRWKDEKYQENHDCDHIATPSEKWNWILHMRHSVIG